MGVLRRVVVVLGLAWLVLGIAAIVLGVAGGSWLHARLPELTIDAAALGGGMTAVGVGIGLVGAVHVGIARALAFGSIRIMSAGALLAATCAVALIGLAVAALTGIVTWPQLALPLLGVGGVLISGAAVYLACFVALLRRIGAASTGARAGSGTSGDGPGAG
jgi:hypothetical protein